MENEYKICPLIKDDILDRFIPTVTKDGKFLKCVRKHPCTCPITGHDRSYTTVDFCFYDNVNGLL